MTGRLKKPRQGKCQYCERDFIQTGTSPKICCSRRCIAKLWQKKNPEKGKEYDTTRYIRNKEKVLKRQKDYYQNRKHKILEYKADYRSKNKEAIKKRMSSWIAKNSEYIKERNDYKVENITDGYLRTIFKNSGIVNPSGDQLKLKRCVIKLKRLKRKTIII